MTEDKRTENEKMQWPFPDEVILGMERLRWPVQAFTTEGHALSWVKDDPANRHVRRVRCELIADLVYVPPGEPRLVPDQRGA